MNYEQLINLPWQEFLDEVLRDGPKDTTWYAKSDWLEAQYTSEQIAHMYVKLHKQLIVFTPDNKLEDVKADYLRDNMDIFCYATEQELIEKYLKDI